MDVKTRQVTLEDRERIAQFLQAAYEDRVQFKYPARWLWEFIDNPFLTDDRLEYIDQPFLDADHLLIWIAELEGQIVGQICGMLVPLKLGDRLYRIPWLTDYIVLPEYRRRGIGQALMEAVRQTTGVGMGAVMAPISRKVADNVGAQSIDAGIQLSKTLRFVPDKALEVVEARLGETSALTRLCRRLRLGGVIAPALDLSIRLRDVRRLRAGDFGVVIERIERFGDESDQLWARLAPHFPIIVERDAAYLNWKFVEQPHVQYDKFVAKQGKEMCGYVITRRGVPPEPNMGVIADVFAAPDDDIVLQALLAHAVKHLRRGGVNNIIAATSVASYAAHFFQLGFTETQQMVPMLYCTEPTAQNLASDPRNWFLSMGDHDWDQYPLL